jgi:hypothetical protein
VIQYWDYFSACIYTPQEYARDQEDFRWELRGKQFSYKAIFVYFRGLARAQSLLLEDRTDIRVFAESLRHLSNLNTIRLSFHGAKEDQLLWFSNRVFIGDSLLTHLETILRGIAAAQAAKITLKYIEIDGMHSKLTTVDDNMLEVATCALADVESLTLIDSPGFLDFVSHVPLPSLRRLELAKCWLVSLNLRKFLKAQDGRVLHASFKVKNQLYHETWNTGDDSELKALSESFVCSGNIGLQDCLLLTGDCI